MSSTTKEDISFIIELIKNYPVAMSVVSAVFGSSLTYLGFFKGVISIPSNTRKMAMLEESNENMLLTIKSIKTELTSYKEAEKKDYAELKAEVKELRSKT